MTTLTPNTAAGKAKNPQIMLYARVNQDGELDAIHEPPAILAGKTTAEVTLMKARVGEFRDAVSRDGIAELTHMRQVLVNYQEARFGADHAATIASIGGAVDALTAHLPQMNASHAAKFINGGPVVATDGGVTYAPVNSLSSARTQRSTMIWLSGMYARRSHLAHNAVVAATAVAANNAGSAQGAVDLGLITREVTELEAVGEESRFRGLPAIDPHVEGVDDGFAGAAIAGYQTINNGAPTSVQHWTNLRALYTTASQRIHLRATAGENVVDNVADAVLAWEAGHASTNGLHALTTAMRVAGLEGAAGAAPGYPNNTVGAQMNTAPIAGAQHYAEDIRIWHTFLQATEVYISEHTRVSIGTALAHIREDIAALAGAQGNGVAAIADLNRELYYLQDLNATITNRIADIDEIVHLSNPKSHDPSRTFTRS